MVTLGRICTINAFSSIGHDAILGDISVRGVGPLHIRRGMLGEGDK